MSTDPEEVERNFERARREAAERQQSPESPRRKRTSDPLARRATRARDVIQSPAPGDATRRRPAESVETSRMETSRIWIATFTLLVTTVVIWVIAAVILGFLTGGRGAEITALNEIFVGVMLVASGVWAHVILSALYRR